MLFLAYKIMCLSLLKKYFCTANFDEINKHLEYIKKQQTDSWDYVVLNKKGLAASVANLEKQLIDNFRGEN